MLYGIKAHETRYSGVAFRSRLEARWAAFFDYIGWKWEYEPIDLIDWVPDFRVEFPCNHSECSGSHSLFVEVKPYYMISDFDGHPCTKHYWGDGIEADSSAAFGINPDVAFWEMSHGAGGGCEEGPWCFDNWKTTNINVSNAWKMAGNIVRYKP
jgi:hypothetical protein